MGSQARGRCLRRMGLPDLFTHDSRGRFGHHHGLSSAPSMTSDSGEQESNVTAFCSYSIPVVDSILVISEVLVVGIELTKTGDGQRMNVLGHVLGSKVVVDHEVVQTGHCISDVGRRLERMQE